MVTRETIRWLIDSEYSKKVFRAISGGESSVMGLKRLLSYELWLLRHIIQRLKAEGLISEGEEGYVLTEKGREVDEILTSLEKVKEL